MAFRIFFTICLILCGLVLLASAQNVSDTINSIEAEITLSSNVSSVKIDTNQPIRMKLDRSRINNMRIYKLSKASSSELYEILNIDSQSSMQGGAAIISEYLFPSPIFIRYSSRDEYFANISNYNEELQFDNGIESQRINAGKGELKVKRRSVNNSQSCIGICATVYTVTAQYPDQIIYLSINQEAGSIGKNSIEVYQGLAQSITDQVPILKIDNANNGATQSLKAIGSCTILVRNYLPNYSVNLRLTYHLSNERMLTASQGTIRNIVNNNTGQHFNNARDKWVINITAPINFKFVNVSLEKNADKLVLRDASNSSKLTWTGELNDNSIHRCILQGPVAVEFFSDYSVTRDGFVIDYTVDYSYNKNLPALFVNTNSRGMIKRRAESAAKYRNNQTTAWVFNVTANQLIDFNLQFLDINITSNYKLTIHKGLPSEISNKSQIIQFTGDFLELRQWALVTEGTVTVTFEADSQNVGDTFELKHYIPAIKTVTTNAANMSLMTPIRNAANESSPNPDQVMKIDVNGTVRLSVTSFDGKSLWLYDSSSGKFAARFILKNGDNSSNVYLLQGPVLLWLVCDNDNGVGAVTFHYTTVSDQKIKMPTKILKTRRPGKMETDKYLGYDSATNNNNKYLSAIVLKVQKNRKTLVTFSSLYQNINSTDSLQVYNGFQSNMMMSDSPMLEIAASDLDSMNANEIDLSSTATIVYSLDTLRTKQWYFSLYYLPVKEVTVTSTTGYISSRINPKDNKYYVNVDERTIINVDSFVRIWFNQYNLEFTDNVLLYDATTEINEDRLFSVVKNAGQALETEYVLRGPVLVRFKSDRTVSMSDGFSITYTTENTEQFTQPTEIITADGTRQIFSHPLYQPGLSVDYPNNFVKVWQILGKPEQNIELRITQFKTQSPADTLTIHRGLVNDFTNDSQVALLTGEDGNEINVTVSGNVTLVFRTDKSEANEGFRVQFMNIPIIKLKPDSMNYIRSRSRETGENYDDADDKWIIESDSFVRIKFDRFSTSPTSKLMLYQATTQVDDDKLISIVTQEDEALQTEYVLQGPVLVRYKIRKYSSNYGFAMNVTADDAEKFSQPTEIIKVHGSCIILSHPTFGNENYPNNFVKIWQILAKPKQNIDLKLAKFKTQSPGDTLTIHRGLVNDLTSDSQVAMFTGEDVNEKLVSLSGDVTLIFRTDASEVNEGFKIEFENYPAITINNRTGSISNRIDPDTNAYYSNSDERWIFNTTDPIFVRFTKFDLERNYDVVKIYDATTTVTDSALKFTVNDRVSALGSKFLLRGPAVIRFTSDGSGERTGFDINFTVLSRDDERAKSLVTGIFDKGF